MISNSSPKKLKFRSNLMESILSGSMTSTWRLWDDKNIQTGDRVDFLEYGTEKHFATVLVEKVLEKKLGNLTPEDKLGHQNPTSPDEMYRVFSDYYKKPVNADTQVKIIWFKLV